MTQAKRVLAALALATGASALAAPAASAASPEIPTGTLSVMDTVDTLAGSSVAPEHREQAPSASEQLSGLNRLAGVPHDLDPLTSQLAPVTGLLGA
jgi:TolA-binding protein